MKKQSGFASILAIIIALLILLLIGYLYYQANQKGKSAANTGSSAKTAAPADPYEGWKTYASSYEKVSFKYPSDWKLSDYDRFKEPSEPSADGALLTSPSGKVKVSWMSNVAGLGGACDDTAPLGDDGACALFKIIETKELTGLDMYYAAGVVTSDGVKYRPWAAIQSKNGILSEQRTLGIYAFPGKGDPHTAFLNLGDGVTGEGVPEGTEAEAKAFFDGDETKEARLIMQSATY